MTKIAITPNASGTGTFTIAAPNSNDNRTFTLPDATGEVYTSGNILGTVSESGGVPTGAIIERGSNANGEFVKYADGTMICLLDRTFTSVAITTAAAGGFRSAGQSFTFPANFVDLSAVVNALSHSSNLQAISAWSNHSSTDPTVFLWRGDSSTQTQRVKFIAIGRWF